MVDDVGSLKIRPLSPKLLENAKKNVNEVPERRAADVQAIRDWLKKQAHIRAEPSDQMIITFLRGCKFSLERTKEKLDMHYTMKSMVPELFKNRDLKNGTLREILELGGMALLPGADDNGSPILFMRGGREEPGKYKAEDLFKINFMVTDYLLDKYDDFVINGSIGVMDMSGIKLAHGTSMTPSIMKKLVVCSEEGYPYRPKGMHYINTHAFMDTVFKFFQSFQKEKMNRRTHMHGKDYQATLFEKVPKELLPKEYGGDAGSIDDISKDLIQKILDFNDWFLADEKNGVDEKKRVGRKKTQEELFGMEGSFRQLTVD